MSARHIATGPLRLYVVTVAAEIVVLATSPERARQHAISTGAEALSGGDYEDAEPLTRLPSTWELRAIPFGADDCGRQRTIGEWIEAGAAPHYRSEP